MTADGACGDSDFPSLCCPTYLQGEFYLKYPSTLSQISVQKLFELTQRHRTHQLRLYGAILKQY